MEVLIWFDAVDLVFCFLLVSILVLMEVLIWFCDPISLAFSFSACFNPCSDGSTDLVNTYYIISRNVS